MSLLATPSSMDRTGATSRTQPQHTRHRQPSSGRRQMFRTSSPLQIGFLQVRTTNCGPKLQEMACKKRHPNIECLKRSLRKAAVDFPVDVLCNSIDGWPQTLKDCVCVLMVATLNKYLQFWFIMHPYSSCYYVIKISNHFVSIYLKLRDSTYGKTRYMGFRTLHLRSLAPVWNDF